MGLERYPDDRQAKHAMARWKERQARNMRIWAEKESIAAEEASMRLVGEPALNPPPEK